MEVKLTRLIENPVEAIEEAASNCYDSIPTGGAIMNHCYQSGHHSVLEFAHFTFHVTGVSRALTHQLVRHRMASYAQRSQRYCKEDGFDFVVPESIGSSPWAEEYLDLMEDITKVYDGTEYGIARRYAFSGAIRWSRLCLLTSSFTRLAKTDEVSS